MRILVTGRGGAASWVVRGEQIGAALGATVKVKASLADMKAADVILVVKRVPEEMRIDLQKCGRPWVYDIVDPYPQREAIWWTPSAAIGWLKEHVRRLNPTAVIWPTAKMREDCGIGGTTIYHHARPGLALNPIRPRIELVGYEGHPRYLDGMIPAIADVCTRRGAAFLVGPSSLAEIDVVIAIRGRDWRSYPSLHWKSNVKLANAHASGTPFIGSPEAGYVETSAGCEYWADTPKQIGLALDWLETQETRETVRGKFLAKTLTLETIAAQTREALCCAARS